MSEQTDSDFTVTDRNVDVQHGRLGPLVNVIGLDFENRSPNYVPRKTLGSYAFRRCEDAMADEIRGEIQMPDGQPVIYIGDNFGKHYYRSKDFETVPVDVLEWLNANDFVLVRNVDGGWVKWEGRPEFSDSYVDFSEAEVVDMDAEIAQRRD